MKQRSRKIQTTIALAFAALVFGTALVIGIISYTFTRDTVEESSREYTEQLIDQVQTNIDSYIDHMENVAEVVQLNEQVQRFFGDEVSTDERAFYRGRISAFLTSIAGTRSDISLILIVGDNGEVLSQDPTHRLRPDDEILGQPWYERARARSGTAVISSSHVQNVVEGEYRWVITLSRTINDPLTGVEHGVMLVDLNFSVISKLVRRISLGTKGYLFIVASDGSIVYHPRQELIYSDLEQEYIDRVLEERDGSFVVSDEKGERIYTVSTSGRTGWRTVGVNYSSELVRNRPTIQRYYLYWTLACIVIAILVAVLISHRLSQPILRLRSSMRVVEQGNFDISVDVSGNNEIGELAKDFNIMIGRIKELVQRNAEEQEEKRKSELLALQNQITPHFLYNTLDSIIWMAEAKQYSQVVKMVASLARLLRLSISRGDELVSVRDEIQHIKNYLTIQKMRYTDMLDFTIDVDGSIQDLLVPKVILQPLVENAIYHGIKNKDGGGSVTVRGLRDGDDVLLEVSDDGVGADLAHMEEILARETGPPTPSDTPRSQRGAVAAVASASSQASAEQARHRSRRRARVGIANVHERIRLYFGNRYGLRFGANERSADGGTTVQVRLPVVSPDGDHRDGGDGR
jgi:two-component system sensor histidine kinase YesM